jgi:hypothetical protein
MFLSQQQLYFWSSLGEKSNFFLGILCLGFKRAKIRLIFQGLFLQQERLYVHFSAITTVSRDTAHDKWRRTDEENLGAVSPCIIIHSNKSYQPDASISQIYCSSFNLYEPCVLYVGRGYRYPPDVAFYIFFQQL